MNWGGLKFPVRSMLRIKIEVIADEIIPLGMVQTLQEIWISIEMKLNLRTVEIKYSCKYGLKRSYHSLLAQEVM